MASCNKERGLKKARRNASDTLKASLRAFDINLDTWGESALDRDKWCAAVEKGPKLCEARTAVVVQERQARKLWANSLPDTVPLTVCPHCQRSIRPQIGLYSHPYTHRQTSSIPSDPPPLSPPPEWPQDDPHRNLWITHTCIIKSRIRKKKKEKTSKTQNIQQQYFDQIKQHGQTILKLEL